MSKLLNALGIIGFSLPVGWMSAASAEGVPAKIKIEVSPDAWPCFSLEYAENRPEIFGFDMASGFEVVIVDGVQFLSGDETQERCLEYSQEWERSGHFMLGDRYPEVLPQAAQHLQFAEFYSAPLAWRIWEQISREYVKRGDQRMAFFISAELVSKISSISVVCGAVRELRADFPEVCNFDELQEKLTDALAVYEQFAKEADVGPEAHTYLTRVVAEGVANFEAIPRWP